MPELTQKKNPKKTFGYKIGKEVMEEEDEDENEDEESDEEDEESNSSLRESIAKLQMTICSPNNNSCYLKFTGGFLLVKARGVVECCSPHIKDNLILNITLNLFPFSLH
ncbi:hypothetical protein M9H77_03639 [Catharanthus roseus]|uniref:Uncharacterized protein n=1 Tax=Catharanthus roseus TaxID=4058 RepID=A0ACC0CBW9_CATRO|nr:hypothetical protein M9H77_03639 [Catharanthus roseus]